MTATEIEQRKEALKRKHYLESFIENEIPMGCLYRQNKYTGEWVLIIRHTLDYIFETVKQKSIELPESDIEAAKILIFNQSAGS